MLILAAAKGNVDVVTTLLQHGADVHSVDGVMLMRRATQEDLFRILICSPILQDDCNALMMAAKHGRIDVVMALLGKGADANIVNKVHTLIVARLRQISSISTQLMSNEFMSCCCGCQDGNSALSLSLFMTHCNVFQELQNVTNINDKVRNSHPSKEILSYCFTFE